MNPFTPGATVLKAFTSSSSRIALPVGIQGNQLRVASLAANDTAFIAFGTVAITAAVTDLIILPGTVELFTISPDVTNVAVIGATSTGTMYFTRGDGE